MAQPEPTARQWRGPQSGGASLRRMPLLMIENAVA